MLRNYVKVAIRNVSRFKGYAAINIVGLAIGMAGCIIITLWVIDELSYDRFHSEGERIFRVIKDGGPDERSNRSALTSPPIAPYIKENFPEVVLASRFGNWGNRVVICENESFMEPRYEHVDPEFFEMFSFQFVKGDPSTVFADMYSVVLTEATARKYFGDANPMGRTLSIEGNFDVTVTGVLADLPTNSSLQFDLLSPFSLLSEFIGEEPFAAWGFNAFTSFVQLAEKESAAALAPKIVDLYSRHESDMDEGLVLQPLLEIHLDPSMRHNYDGIGDRKYVYIFSALAVFVLLIACINFMNLATARSARRAREVGMRKVVGASRRSIALQFIGESILLSAVALLFALLLVEIYLPVFNELAGKELSLGNIQTGAMLMGLAAVVLVTGILSGSYPAVVISSLQPVMVLKGGAASGAKGALFRKILVVAQFSLSIVLIIGVMVVSRQVKYLHDRDLGINTDHVVSVRMVGDSNVQYPLLRDRILEAPGVISVTGSFDSPEDISSSPGCPEWDGKLPGEDWPIRAEFVDFDYFETFQIELAAGRTFSRDFPSDSNEAYIVNEEAVRRMRIESPVGQNFAFWDRPGKIVGVVKDFHFQPLHNKIEPIVFTMNPEWLSRIHLRIRPDNVAATMAAVEEIWKDLCPHYPFDYHFVDEDYDNLYRAERRMSVILGYFTFLAILIACLGLFGLASFMGEQRTREIGIRKALGATVSGIVIMFSREFTKWVLISSVIAWPVAYFVMRKWLENFAYRTELGWYSFALATVMAVVIAWITVAYQSIRAASANPVDSLRSE